MTDEPQADARAVTAVRVGDRLPDSEVVPSVVQIFRYSAVTWNTHRIHFDLDYAKREGYPAVLVQSHLHGAFLIRYCTDWMGSAGRLTKLGLSVRRFAVPDDPLVITAIVTTVDAGRTGTTDVHLDLAETRRSDGVACATGSAVVSLYAADHTGTTEIA